MRNFGPGQGRLLRVIPAMAVGAALLGVGFVQSGAAEASFGWCAGDPVIAVNGKQFHVTIGVQGDPTTLYQHVTSANIVIHVPSNTTAQTVSSSSPYFSENVTFVYDKGPVAAGKSIPVTVITTFTRPSGGQDLPAQMIDQTTKTATVNGHLHDTLKKDLSVS
ncbi:MAG TPA: hypothetical protein VFD32_17820 [Dehalococcoidia bacterium]|nr:hypothetical protein [Dehalococcoidia bacterium]